MFMRNDGKSLTISNVQKDDLLNIQCNISNVHGYIYSDAYLNVFCKAHLIISAIFENLYMKLINIIRVYSSEIKPN